MTTTRLSVKGQIVIPKALRDARHWGPGTRLHVTETTEGLLLTPAGGADKQSLAAGLAALRERAGYTGPVRTVTEMHQAVVAEATRRTNPGRSRKR